MEDILIIIFLSFSLLITYLVFSIILSKLIKTNYEKDEIIEDLEKNIKELVSELKSVNTELQEANRIINSNEFIINEFEGINLKLEISKFYYENHKQERLNEFMQNYISKYVIWNESPDKKNMIGELFVYVKKE
jgi:hypothetical protein